MNLRSRTMLAILASFSSKPVSRLAWSPGVLFFAQVDVNENYFVKLPTPRGRFSVAQEQPSLPERRVQITQSSVNSEHKHFSKRDWTSILSRFCCRQNLWESSLQIEHSPWPCGGSAGFARLWRRGPLNLAWAGTFQQKKRQDCHFTREKKPVGDFENISVLTNFLQVWIVYFVTNLNKTDFMGKILVDRDFLKSRHLEVKVPIVVAVELFYTCRSKMFL